MQTLHYTAVKSVVSLLTALNPTCVQVEQFTLSPALKAMMLYFLQVFLREINMNIKKNTLHALNYRDVCYAFLILNTKTCFTCANAVFCFFLKFFLS